MKAKGLLEVASNSAVAMGVLFLLDIAGGFGLGTPVGTAGALSGLALIAFGVAAIMLPHQLRRSRIAHAARVRQAAAMRRPRLVAVPSGHADNIRYLPKSVA